MITICEAAARRCDELHVKFGSDVVCVAILSGDSPRTIACKLAQTILTTLSGGKMEAEKAEEKETVGWKVAGKHGVFVGAPGGCWVERGAHVFIDRQLALKEAARWHSSWNARLVLVTRKKRVRVDGVLTFDGGSLRVTADGTRTSANTASFVGFRDGDRVRITKITKGATL